MERSPQPHSNFSYKNFPLVHLQSSVIPGQPSSSWFKWIGNPNSHIFSFSWSPTPQVQAHFGGAEPVTEGGARPSLKDPPSPNVTLLTFLKPHLGSGMLISGESVLERRLHNLLSVWSWGVVNHQTLDANVNDFEKFLTFVWVPQNHVVTPSVDQFVDVFSIELLHLWLAHSLQSAKWFGEKLVMKKCLGGWETC